MTPIQPKNLICEGSPGLASAFYDEVGKICQAPEKAAKNTEPFKYLMGVSPIAKLQGYPRSPLPSSANPNNKESKLGKIVRIGFDILSLGIFSLSGCNQPEKSPSKDSKAVEPKKLSPPETDQPISQNNPKDAEASPEGLILFKIEELYLKFLKEEERQKQNRFATVDLDWCNKVYLYHINEGFQLEPEKIAEDCGVPEVVSGEVAEARYLACGMTFMNQGDFQAGNSLLFFIQRLEISLGKEQEIAEIIQRFRTHHFLKASACPQADLSNIDLHYFDRKFIALVPKDELQK